MYSAVGGEVAYKGPQSKVMDNAAQGYDLLCRLDFITTNRGLLKPPAMIRICQVLLSVPSVLHADVRSKPINDYVHVVFGKESILGTVGKGLCR